MQPLAVPWDCGGRTLTRVVAAPSDGRTVLSAGPHYGHAEVSSSFDLNLLYGRVGAIDGAQIGGVNVVSREASPAALQGLQIGLGANVVDGKVSGLQFAGVLNYVDGATRGGQFALGANLDEGSVHGMQGAFVFNRGRAARAAALRRQRGGRRGRRVDRADQRGAARARRQHRVGQHRRRHRARVSRFLYNPEAQSDELRRRKARLEELAASECAAPEPGSGYFAP